MTDDSIQGGLHGAGGNAEGLDVIGANPERDGDGDEEDFEVVGQGVGRAIGFEGMLAGSLKLS